MNNDETLAAEYQEQDFIDAKDNQGDWRVGYILDKIQISKLFKIRFDGWSSKYDEVYRFDSYKLKPFRSMVTGYTGQKQNPGIRASWKFTDSDLQQRTNKLKQAIAKGPEMKASYLNQLLRGHNYMYTDYLMTITFSCEESIAHVLKFFQMNIELVCKYLDSVDPQFKNYYLSQEKPLEGFLFNGSAAYDCSFVELFDTLYIITGSYARFHAFWTSNAELLRKMLQIDDTKDPKNQHLLSVATAFSKNGGFKTIKALLEIELPKAQNLTPFLFLHSLAHLYSGFKQCLGLETIQATINSFKLLTEKNIQKLNKTNLKDFHQKNLVDFLKVIEKISTRTKLEKIVEKWTSKIKLEVCYRMIDCPYFEKRLKGISGIIELCESKEEVLKDGTIKKWMADINLLEMVFVNNDNAEIIKKGAQLCKYLFNHDNLSFQQITIIWNSRSGKHQAALKQLYGLISQLPSRDKPEQSNIKLFQIISKVPSKEWDEDYIGLLKDFTLNSVTWVHTEGIKHTYGFTHFYNYLVNHPSQELLTGFIQIADRFEKTPLLESFVERCFENIKNNKDADIHIEIVLKIIREQLSSLKNQKIPMAEIILSNLLLHPNERNRLKDKFDLLSETVKALGLTVSFEACFKLWNVYINSKGRDVFLSWICKKKESGKYFINQLISPETRKKLLEQVWSSKRSKEFINIEEQEAQILIQLCRSVNSSEGRIKKINLTVQIETLDLYGLAPLWQVFFATKNQEAAKALSNFIVELHTSPSKNFQEDKELLTANFIATIIKHLQVAHQEKNSKIVNKMIQMTEILIQRDQQIYPIKQINKVQYFKDVNVINRTTKQDMTLRFNTAESFYELKKLIAERIKLPLHKFKVYYKGEQIRYENYFKSLLESSFNNNKFDLVQTKDSVSFLKTTLNQNLELFFQLLGDANIEKNVWRIVSKLPVSNSVLVSAKNSSIPWPQLTNTSMYKELYMLRVIYLLNQQWFERFNSEGGLKFLLQKLTKAQSKTEIEREYLLYLLKNMVKALSLVTSDKIDVVPGKLFTTAINSLSNMFIQIEQDGSINTSMEASIIHYIFLIGSHTKKIKSAILQITSFGSCINFLKIAMITVENQQLRQQFCKNLRALCVKLTSQEWKTLIDIMQIQIFPSTINFGKPSQLMEFVELNSFILAQAGPEIKKQLFKNENKKIIANLFSLIQAEKRETKIDEPNVLLYGYLRILSELVFIAEFPFKKTVLRYIFNECLFSSEDSQCKSKESRNACFNLINSLLTENELSDEFIEFFSRLHQKGKWRSRKIDDWTIVQSDKLKSSTGYVGLKNLGCTCYMNSLFQQIFMVEKFRNGIIACEDPYYSPKDEDENVLFQLKKMFMNLLLSSKRYYNPRQFCHAFKDYEGKPTNIHEQMDIDQFSGLLFDRLETQLKGSKHQKCINKLFTGVYSNQIISKGCSHISQTQQSFISMSLSVKNKKNIYQSLDTMIKGDMLDGDNAYFCQRCNKKVAAVKRVCLKQLPQHLFITLKRFQFDYELMTKVKVNDFYEFPLDLDLKEYSQQFLRQKEKHKSFDQKEVLPESYYKYALKGICIHMGYADSGHYYSFICDRRDGKWYEFNDTLVRSFNISQLEEEAFGGEIAGIQVKEKIKNAYMLLYERVEASQPDALELTDKKILAQLHQYPTFTNLLQQIKDDNIEQNIEAIIFSKEYYNFIEKLLQKLPELDSSRRKNMIEFILLVWLTSTIREKDETAFIPQLKAIIREMNKYPELYTWVLSIFCDPLIVDEFLKNNPLRDRKKLISYFLVEMVIHAQKEMAKRFISLLMLKISAENENTLQFCMIMAQGCHHLEWLCDYLVEEKIVARLIENMLRKDPRLITEFKMPTESAETVIGHETFVEKSPWELTKKAKPDNEHGYVWSLLNNVIHRAQEKQLPLVEYLTETQAGYMRFPVTKVSKVLEECKTKHQIRHFCKFVAFLAYQNEPMSITLMSVIQKCLTECISKRYRQYFTLYAQLLSINDSLHEKRLKSFLKIQKALQENQKYLLDLNILQQWTIKFISRNKGLQKLLLKEEEFYQYLLKLTTRRVPSEDVARKNVDYTEPTVNKLHGIKFPRTKKGYTRLAKLMEEAYLKLKQASTLTFEGMEWESGEDITDLHIKQGQNIAYFDAKDKVEYQEAEIDQIFLNRLKLVLKSAKVVYIWKDDEKLTNNLKVIGNDTESEANSSQTTEMDADEVLSLEQPEN